MPNTQARAIDLRILFTVFILVIGLCLVTAPAMAKNPYLKPDDTWITISGTVESVTRDSFELDYGDGTITVEMDDGDRDADGYKLIAGDKVTVNGLIDDDFYETTKIEASSVFVEKLGTTFFASAIDEEDYIPTVIAAPVIVSAIEVRGTVTEVNGDEFTIDTALREITVDVDEMSYNPLDEEGYQKIEVGDYVKVNGEIDEGLFENREIKADYVVELID